MHGWCHCCRPENTKRLHSLQHACSGTVGSAWGTSGSCRSDCDLASLLDLQNTSPVADNAGKIPARPDLASGAVQRRGPLHHAATGLQVVWLPFCSDRLPTKHQAMGVISGPCVHVVAAADMMSANHLMLSNVILGLSFVSCCSRIALELFHRLCRSAILRRGATCRRGWPVWRFRGGLLTAGLRGSG